MGNIKLIMSYNARETQRSLEEYNSRKLILQALKSLKNIPSLRNDTIYRNQIAEGIIHNTEIYRLIQQGRQNFANWVKKHPLIARNQSYRLREFETLQKAYKQQNSRYFLPPPSNTTSLLARGTCIYWNFTHHLDYTDIKS